MSRKQPKEQMPLYKRVPGASGHPEIVEEVIYEIYQSHDINSLSDLSNVTKIPKSTLSSALAYKSPSQMPYQLFIRICEALNEDKEIIEGMITRRIVLSLDKWIMAYKSYTSTKGRLGQLVDKYLSLTEENQGTVLRMIDALEPDSSQEDKGLDGGSSMLADQFKFFMENSHFQHQEVAELVAGGFSALYDNWIDSDECAQARERGLTASEAYRLYQEEKARMANTEEVDSDE